MFEKKRSSSGPTLVVACAGCPEYGNTAGEIAGAIAGDGFAEALDLSAMEAGSDRALQRARRSSGIIVVDGCSKACARIVMEKNMGSLPHAFVLTDDAWKSLGAENDGTVDFSELKRAIKITYAQNRMLMASMCDCGCVRG